jgi:hypothetical protein
MSIRLKKDPHTSDGRSIIQVSKFRGDVDPYLCGSGDDRTNGMGAGSKFSCTWDGFTFSDPPTAEEKEEVIDFYFNDWLYLAAGGLNWTGGKIGCTIDMWLEAPATVVVSNPGAGNCNLVATGYGFNAVVAAAGDGSHDMSDPAPVPKVDADGKGEGYWDWDEPNTGLGNMIFDPNGKGFYNLYDAPLKLVHWVCNLPLIGDGTISLDPQTKARKILPHWHFKVKVVNEPAVDPFTVAFWLNTARKQTG